MDLSTCSTLPRGWRVWGDVGYARTTPGAQSLIAPVDAEPPEFWFVTQDGQLAHVRDDTVLAIVAPEPSLGAITALTFDHTSTPRLWVATENGGPTWWDGRALVPASPELFSGRNTRDLVAHKSGRKMLAATSNGLWMLDSGWSEIPVRERAGNAEPRFGTDLAWVRLRDDRVIVGHEAEFAVSVGDTGGLTRDLFGLPILDGALDAQGTPGSAAALACAGWSCRRPSSGRCRSHRPPNPLPDWQTRHLETLIGEVSQPDRAR